MTSLGAKSSHRKSAVLEIACPVVRSACVLQRGNRRPLTLAELERQAANESLRDGWRPCYRQVYQVSECPSLLFPASSQEADQFRQWEVVMAPPHHPATRRTWGVLGANWVPTPP